MQNKIYALCKAARKITDAELTEIEGVAKQHTKVTGKMNPEASVNAASRESGERNLNIIRLVRELRDAVRAG